MTSPSPDPVTAADAADLIRDCASRYASPVITRSLSAGHGIPLRAIYDLIMRSARVSSEDRARVLAAGRVLDEAVAAAEGWERV